MSGCLISKISDLGSAYIVARHNTMVEIIGLAGRKRVGKDSAAEYLVRHYGYTRLAFADPLKVAVAGLFGISMEEVEMIKNNSSITLVVGGRKHLEISGREFLQRFGTEMGREIFGRYFWVSQWEKALNEEMLPVVTPDVRFVEEAEAIRKRGGIVVEIVRSGVQDNDSHLSEQPLPKKLVDVVVANNGSLADLYQRMDLLIK